MKQIFSIIIIIVVIIGFDMLLRLPAKPEMPVEIAQTDSIRVVNPLPQQAIQSPLIVRGEARGSWFFEATFPVVLVDWDGRIIGTSTARAQKDWMTNDFVPFEAMIDFTADKNTYINKGALILRKDNPSGLPENDDSIEIPVKFSELIK